MVVFLDKNKTYFVIKLHCQQSSQVLLKIMVSPYSWFAPAFSLLHLVSVGHETASLSKAPLTGWPHLDSCSPLGLLLATALLAPQHVLPLAVRVLAQLRAGSHLQNSHDDVSLKIHRKFFYCNNQGLGKCLVKYYLTNYLFSMFL